MGAEADAWTRFIEQCVLKRKSVKDFESLVKTFSTTNPTTSSGLAAILLKPRSLPSPFAHPLIPRYIERLLEGNRLAVHDVLLTLLDASPYAARTEKPNEKNQERHFDKSNAPNTTDAVKDLRLDILHRIAKLFAGGWAPHTAEWWRSVKALSQWMSSIATHSEGFQLGEDALPLEIGTIFSVLARSERGSSALTSSLTEGKS